MADGISTTATWSAIKILNLHLLTGFYQGGVLYGLQFLLYASGPTDFVTTFALAENWLYQTEDEKIVTIKYDDDCMYIQYTLARLQLLLTLDAEK